MIPTLHDETHDLMDDELWMDNFTKILCMDDSGG